MKNCPQAASSVPVGGHESCPVTAIKAAHRRPVETHSDEGQKPRNYSALPPSSDDLERMLELGRARRPMALFPLIDGAYMAMCSSQPIRYGRPGTLGDLPETRRCTSRPDPQIMAPGSRATCPQAATPTLPWWPLTGNRGGHHWETFWPPVGNSYWPLTPGPFAIKFLGSIATLGARSASRQDARETPVRTPPIFAPVAGGNNARGFSATQPISRSRCP
jgi:hypothetical protein